MRFKVLVLAALVAGSASAVLAGGWTVVTFKNVPTHLLAGENTFIYTVRQHGHTPLNGLEGHVRATKGDLVLNAAARPFPAPGAYDVSVRFPEPGTWTLEFVAGSGLLGDTVTMTVDVLPRGVEAPAVPAAARGRRLFEGKGCVMCHAHEAFSGRKIANLVDLTNRTYTTDFVKTFLRTVPGKPTATGERGMPDLGLSDAEIDALAAFLGR